MAAHSDLKILGYFGEGEAARRLQERGRAPTWGNGCSGFSGGSVWSDPSGDVQVAGQVLLDNRQELQGTLNMAGAADGELIATLFRAHGPETGKHILGMFGVAIWDRRRRGVTLLRDALGGRTMYYTYSPSTGGWWFANQLNELHQIGGSDLSLAALRDYLTYAYIPGGQTLWEGIREVRPGTSLSLPSALEESYWEPRESLQDPGEPLAETAARLRLLLEGAVAQRLPPAGPVGVYLSGGVDSSLVTAIAAAQAPGRIHTYSISFGPGYPGESAFSEMVARHCGTTHHVLEITPEMVRERLWQTMGALDDPIGDPLTVPNYLLGQEARRDVDVILNGEGGDPVFGGPKNQTMLLHSLYSPGGGDETAYLRAYRKCYTDLSALLLPDVQRSLSTGPKQEVLLEPFFQDGNTSNYLHRLMHINIRLKGADHILTKVNNLTTSSGLIGHSPLFDRRLVDAAFACRPEFKMAGVEEKVVLKRAVSDLLPETIIQRPKSGMMVPVNAWLKGDLLPYVKLMLGVPRPKSGVHSWLSQVAEHRFARRPAASRENGSIWRYLDPALAREWLSPSSDSRAGAKLWMLLSLEVWLQVNSKGNGEK